MDSISTKGHVPFDNQECLAHIDWMMHTGVSNWIIVSPSNCLSSKRNQTIIWTNGDVLPYYSIKHHNMEDFWPTVVCPSIYEMSKILWIQQCQYRWLARYYGNSWWRHQIETFSALLAICAGNSPVTGEFPAQRPVTRSFDVFFDLRLNKRLSKQWWGWWYGTPSRPLWRHCNGQGFSDD